MMFYYLRGSLAYNDGQTVVVDCAGVGYSLTVTALTAAALGEVGTVATVYTHMAFRQDVVELYGFHDMQELETFKTLISVSGVGPKVAVGILSTLTPSQFALAVMSGDTHTITRAPGVGAKLASRIALELKDKVDAALPDEFGDLPAVAAMDADNGAEAVKALMVLGYSRHQAQNAVRACDGSQPVEEIVRQALRLLMK